MDPRELIEDNLELIDRLTRSVCRRCGVAAGEVDDALSTVTLALVEKDYAILRRYEGRSSIATYLTVVIQRLLSEEHRKKHGRWRSSSLALADRLPQRPPQPREVPLPPEEIQPLASSDRADAAALDRELRGLSGRANALLRETISAWPAEDRMLVRLRFESSLSIADAARLMKVPQRPLYRRLQSLLARLREVLMAAGVNSSAVGDLLGATNSIEMNFSLAWKKGEERPTNEQAGSATAGGEPR
jgi:RNA polymerase sigma factor (sigma-70 family)